MLCTQNQLIKNGKS